MRKRIIVTYVSQVTENEISRIEQLYNLIRREHYPEPRRTFIYWSDEHYKPGLLGAIRHEKVVEDAELVGRPRKHKRKAYK